MNEGFALSLRSITAIFWLGFFMAISFMEAPLKFTAPGLGIAEGLQVGKIIFKALNLWEWTFFLILVTTCIFRKTSRMGFYLITMAGIILVLETKWLLPVLDQGADQIIRGRQVTEHNAHWFYIIFEVIKAPLLLLIGIESGKMLFSEKKMSYHGRIN